MKEFPKNWSKSKLDDLLTFVLGGDWGKSLEYDDPNYTEVRCIRASEMKNWDYEKGSTAAARKIKKTSLESRNLKESDIIVEISGGGPEQPVGRTVIIDKSVLSKTPDVPKVCTNFFRLIRPSSELSSPYLNYFLQYFYSCGKIRNYQAGSNNLRNLKFNNYIEIKIPIAPTNEQKRIVVKIEELCSKLDKGIENLKTARAQLKIYRQAILKHAFEGKLTQQWREDNKDKLEAADELLERIKQEREAHYQQQLEEWGTAVKTWEQNGKECKAPTKPKALQIVDIKDDVTSNLPKLPEGWTWLYLGNVADVSGGLTKNQKRNSLPHRMKYLRVANVYADKVLTDEVYEIGVTDAEARKLLLESGDLLIVEGNGSIEQIGRVAMWAGEVPDCGHQNHLIRARIATKSSPRFLLQFLLSPLGRDFIIKAASSTSGLHTLSISKVSNLIVPITTLAEEKAVLEIVEEKLSMVDKTLEELDIQLAKSESLRQSILKQAFSGKLVAQDPNDEPASVLLERIRAEKEENKKPKKGKVA